MEDTLRGFIFILVVLLVICLNPCFNGRYSQSGASVQFTMQGDGLNPCFNGRYSQRLSFRGEYTGKELS